MPILTLLNYFYPWTVFLSIIPTSLDGLPCIMPSVISISPSLSNWSPIKTVIYSFQTVTVAFLSISLCITINPSDYCYTMSLPHPFLLPILPLLRLPLQRNSPHLLLNQTPHPPPPPVLPLSSDPDTVVIRIHPL